MLVCGVHRKPSHHKDWHVSKCIDLMEYSSYILLLICFVVCVFFFCIECCVVICTYFQMNSDADYVVNVCVCVCVPESVFFFFFHVKFFSTAIYHD